MGSVDGFETVTVVSADGSTEAVLVPGANMVCCSLTHGGTELLHRGAGVRAYAEQGKTMGMPLLHPWANRLGAWSYRAAGRTVALAPQDPRIPRDPEGLPIHGVLPGLLRWEVVPAPGDDLLNASLSWERDELLEVFPFPHRLEIELAVRPGELVMQTTLTPAARQPVPVAFGYHPYLVVPDGSRQGWRVKLGAFRRLVLDGRMIPTGERLPVGRRSFRLGQMSLDDGFDALTVPAEFQARGSGAGITVEFRAGYAFAQVYAPSGADFICFEPMTAPANALISGDGLQLVEPGNEYRAEFAIRLSSSEKVANPI